MNWKKTLVFCLFLVGGVATGSLLAQVCRGIPFLSWLSFSQGFGISSAQPLVLDLQVLTLAFGLSVQITVAHLLCLVLALFGYKAAVKRL